MAHNVQSANEEVKSAHVEGGKGRGGSFNSLLNEKGIGELH